MTLEITEYDNKKLCSCGYCNELIPIYDKRGRPRFFKNGHSSKGINNSMYKNGMYESSTGYIMILEPDHPFAQKGYVQDHRLVMEEFIGRYLIEKEVVHHINKRRWDNRIENLMLFPNTEEHLRFEFRLDMSDRRCNYPNCKNPNKTSIEKNGQPHWRKHLNGYICNRCYMKEYRKKTR